MHMNSLSKKLGHRLSVFNRIYHMLDKRSLMADTLMALSYHTWIMLMLSGRSARSYSTDETIAVFSKSLGKEDSKGKSDIS